MVSSKGGLGKDRGEVGLAASLGMREAIQASRLSLSPENLAKLAFKSLWRCSQGHPVLAPEALGPSWPQKQRTMDVMGEHTQPDGRENCSHARQSLGYVPARTGLPVHHLLQDRWEWNTYCLKRKGRPAQFNLIPHHFTLAWARRSETMATINRVGL